MTDRALYDAVDAALHDLGQISVPLRQLVVRRMPEGEERDRLSRSLDALDAGLDRLRAAHRAAGEQAKPGTEHDRHAAFLDEYEALVRKHGIRLGSNGDTMFTVDVRPDRIADDMDELRRDALPLLEGAPARDTAHLANGSTIALAPSMVEGGPVPPFTIEQGRAEALSVPVSTSLPPTVVGIACVECGTVWRVSLAEPHDEVVKCSKCGTDYGVRVGKDYVQWGPMRLLGGPGWEPA